MNFAPKAANLTVQRSGSPRKGADVAAMATLQSAHELEDAQFGAAPLHPSQHVQNAAHSESVRGSEIYAGVLASSTPGTAWHKPAQAWHHAARQLRRCAWTAMTSRSPSKRACSCGSDVAKRLIDIVGATVGLTVTAPLWLGGMLAVRVTMGSPVLFRDQRGGLGGRPFTLLKLRTMREPAPGESRLASDSARLTRVGQFLRATSIDELPSLLNVLRGDMSLVGPRPLVAKYLARYTPEQARRHEVKPGLTGWAQIHGRNAVDWPERFALDVWYVDHRSLALDLKILVRTVSIVLRREGVRAEGQATMSEFMGLDGP